MRDNIQILGGEKKKFTLAQFGTLRGRGFILTFAENVRKSTKWRRSGAFIEEDTYNAKLKVIIIRKKSNKKISWKMLRRREQKA